MSKIKSHIKQWLKALLYALLTVVIVKSFFFWVYVVPSSSMEKTLLPGDLIFVNKMSYGLRLPITPLTFPLSHHKMPFYKKWNSFSDVIQFPYKRLFETQIKRNDVVVFNYPMENDLPIDHRSFYIKRCIGIPGDKVKIANKKVYVNNKSIPFPNLVEFNYNVQSTINLTNDTLLKYGITEGGRLGGKNFWQLTLTDSIKKTLNGLSYISSIQPLKIDSGNYADYIFPYNKNYSWNVDYFGDIVIPKKGEVVKLNLNNIYLYKRIIEVYEENDLVVNDNQILINGEEKTSYTFNLDYYFMLGDNRHNSSDSRFWGFVPENHIVGKATAVILSVNKKPNNEKKYRWERFFMGIE